MSVWLHTHWFPEQLSPGGQAGHVITSPQLFVAEPHSRPSRAHAAVTDSLQTHRFPEHVSPVSHWLGHATFSAQAFCVVPHSTSSHAAALDWLHTHWPLEHMRPAAQLPQLTVSPQLLVTVPHVLPSHAWAVV